MSEFSRELVDLVGRLAGRGKPDRADGQLSAQWGEVLELGLVGIGTPEVDGGSGGSVDDLMVVIRELARAGIVTPIVEASTAMMVLGTAPQGEVDTIVAVDTQPASPQVGPRKLRNVPFADSSRRLVVVGESAVGSLALVDAKVSPTIDIAGIPWGSAQFDDSAAQTHTGVSAGDLLTRLALARSAALIGHAAGAYELTKKYVSEREQFGRPLTAIPSVANLLGRMLVLIRQAESAMARALAADDTSSDPSSDPSLRRLSSAMAARIVSAQTATAIARAAHQLHGAVGVTREYDLHRHTRPLWALRDADLPERTWTSRLATIVLAGSERQMWECFT